MGKPMTTVTYLPKVECEVTVPEGILETQVVAVPDSENRRHFIRIAKGALNEIGGKQYLSIGIVRVDEKHDRALIELPQEADSGYRRIWVSFERFLAQEGGE
jgi:hypothetical protein